MSWTRFMDMYSGGGNKTGYEYIYIEASEDEAVEMFKDIFGEDPYDVACDCCGGNFSIGDEYLSLEDAIEYEQKYSELSVEKFLQSPDVKVIYSYIDEAKPIKRLEY